MDARSVWFRETGEGRPKEQLLIETMFCVYYLSKGSAFFANARTSNPTSFLRTFFPRSRFGVCSLSRVSCGGDLPLAAAAVGRHDQVDGQAAGARARRSRQARWTLTS